MVVLKKIKASTLMETLVATVLIVIIFMIASLILNNIMRSNHQRNTKVIENRLNKLVYFSSNDVLELPLNEDFNEWNISAEINSEDTKSVIVFKARNTQTNKQLMKTYVSPNK